MMKLKTHTHTKQYQNGNTTTALKRSPKIEHGKRSSITSQITIKQSIFSFN